MTTPSTTAFRPGDVVLVAFPFTDLSASKQRPAVVISSAAYNAAREDVIILAVTSRPARAGALGERAIEDWQAAGLLNASSLKPLVATVEQGTVRRRLGALGARDAAALREVLDEILF